MKIKRYGLYLYRDDPRDATLIQALERAAKLRRANDLIRDALAAYLQGQGRAMPVAQAQTMPLPMPSGVPAMPSSESTASSADSASSIMAKAKRAFLK